MTKKYTLKNGITVLLHNLPNADIVAVYVGVNIGSNHENDNEHGLAHFSEHMHLKGTKKYPTVIDLASKFDSLGLRANAFTSNIHTTYVLIGISKHLDQMIELTSDMFLNATFLSERIEKERGPILEEIKKSEDNIARQMNEVLKLELFPGTPLCHSILGTPESVKSFKREDFIRFLEKNYTTNNTIISIVGDFDDREILDKLESLYSDARVGEHIPQKDIEPSKIKNKHVSIVKKENKQMLVHIGFRSVSHGNEMVFAAKLLGIILGGCRGSRLALNLRTDKSLCYSISSYQLSFPKHGMFWIGAGLSEENLKVAIEEIANECTRIKKEVVSEDELEKAKNNLMTELFHGRQSPTQIVSANFNMFAGTREVFDMDDEIKKINKVTIEDVQKAAQTILDSDNFVAVYAGPLDVPESITEPLKKI